MTGSRRGGVGSGVAACLHAVFCPGRPHGPPRHVVHALLDGECHSRKFIHGPSRLCRQALPTALSGRALRVSRLGGVGGRSSPGGMTSCPEDVALKKSIEFAPSAGNRPRQWAVARCGVHGWDLTGTKLAHLHTPLPLPLASPRMATCTPPRLVPPPHLLTCRCSRITNRLPLLPILGQFSFYLSTSLFVFAPFFRRALAGAVVFELTPPFLPSVHVVSE